MVTVSGDFSMGLTALRDYTRSFYTGTRGEKKKFKLDFFGKKCSEFLMRSYSIFLHPVVRVGVRKIINSDYGEESSKAGNHGWLI